MSVGHAAESLSPYPYVPSGAEPGEASGREAICDPEREYRPGEGSPAQITEGGSDFLAVLLGRPKRWICREWNVSAFPTFYVIDAAGVIRHKNVRDSALEEVVDTLLVDITVRKANRFRR